MKGITILSTEIVSCGIPLWVAPLIGCVFFIIVLLIMVTIFGELDASDFGFGALIGVFVALVFVVVSAGTYKEETHYSMTIDETVSFVEFNEQYEVVDQKGDIYIVRTKEGNEDK